MPKGKEINEEIDQLQILHTITSVYSQIASMWMLRARDSVLKSREYIDEVHQVFLTAFSSYANQIQAMAKRRKLQRGEKITFLSHNGKKVAVFLSANTGFYGEIVNKTFDLFLKEVREQDLEVTIVGHQGLSLFSSEEPNRPHTFFELSDEHVDPNMLQDLVRHLVQYEEIRIYYGKFQNFLTQNPVVFKLSANPYDNLTQDQKAKRYFFEPNIETILIFFEKQIFTSMFEQTVRESQLAKFASRIMVMDRASENIKGRLKSVKTQQLKMTHRIANRKQLNQFASMALWGT
jgi:ATP synthase F1 gamma subunit